MYRSRSRRTLHVRRTLAALATALLTFSAAFLAPTPAQASAPTSSGNAWLDELGRPTQHTQEQVRALATQPWMPAEARDLMLTALEFFAGTGEIDGPPLPENAPPFTQFYWPTVSGNCLGEGLNSVGSAIAVPGPTDIPVPGAADGQTVFLFTALGTPPAEGPQQMTVHWFNVDTLTYGELPLADHGINPEGPATISGVADTGHGRIVAAIEGTVNTSEHSCTFLPTAAFLEAW